MTRLSCESAAGPADLPDPVRWARLLEEVSRYRHSPAAFHAGLAQSRTDYVYAPKVEWIEDD